MRNYFVDGDWNAVCMRCGLKHKASQIKLEWTGMRVCGDCFETRHPQTLLRVPLVEEAAPWTSPEPTDTFITVPYIASNVGTQS